MSYRGHIQNGVIVLDEPKGLPEGAEVRVHLVSTPIVEPIPDDGQKRPTLYERLKPFIGCVDDLPPDMSVNLDHYLYGAPKQRE